MPILQFETGCRERGHAWLPTAGFFLCVLSLATLLLIALLSHAQAATTQGRVALVLGIGDYDNVTRLNNPPKDAAAMAETLQGLGFDVIQGIDVDRTQLIARLQEFNRKAAGADVALFFYSGHGVQVDGENWLLPRDARIENKIDLKLEAIDIDSIIETMRTAKDRILFLDACRDNPFKEGFLAQSATRSINRGLARIDATDPGTLIAFSTSPGAVAYDGGAKGGANSPFTHALLANIGTPGLEIRQVLTRTRQAVVDWSGGRQTPWENSSLLTDIYLGGAPTAASRGDLDRTYWHSIENSQNPDDFSMFLKKFPTSELAMLATSKLKSLETATSSANGVIRDCRDCPEMVAIAAGSFMMGAPATDGNATSSERPVHRADVPAFLLSRFPITFDDWQLCADDGACRKDLSDTGWGKGRRPVIGVTWFDAITYVQWLSRKTSHSYRLPSETEWEYAARAGTVDTHYWGNDDSKACGFANVYDQAASKILKLNWKPYDCSDGFVYTAPVGSFAPNAWNLDDMLGNVWQWVADCWSDDYSGATGEASAASASSCTDRVLRGGSWMSDAASTRVSARMRADPTESDINIGFRVAREAP